MDITDRRVRILSIATCILLVFSISLVAFSAPVSASYWNWGDDDEEWLPPERVSGIGISDEEYTSLWGSVSTIDENGEKYNAFYDLYEQRLGDDGLRRLSQMVLGLDTQPQPTEAHLEWNRNSHRFSTSGEDPSHGEVEDSFLISNAYADIIWVGPHAYFDPGSSTHGRYTAEENKRKYIAQDAELSYVTDSDISSRDNERRGYGLGATKTIYTIVESNVDIMVTATDSNGDVVDTASSNQQSDRVSLDLGSVEAEESVHFDITKDISTEEREENFRRVCVDWETRSRTSYSDGELTRTTYRVCVDREWQETSTTIHYDFVTVSDSTSAVIYNPKVDVSYTVENNGLNDDYFVDVESTQPIAGFDIPDDGYVSLPYGHYTTRDRDYDSSLGSVTPVEHHVITYRVRPSILDNNFADVIYARGDVRYFEHPKGMYISDPDLVLRNIDEIRIKSNTQDFSVSQVTPQPIIPGADMNVSKVENEDSELLTTNLNIEYEPVDRDANQYEIHLSLRDEAADDPIQTSGSSGLNIEVFHSGSGETRTVQTDENGEAVLSYNAHEKDYFDASFRQSTRDQRTSDLLYTEAGDRVQIQHSIDGTSAAMLLMSQGLWYAVFLFGPTLLLLCLLHYGFTGKVHPFR